MLQFIRVMLGRHLEMQRPLSSDTWKRYYIFYLNMVLKWLFIGDTGEDTLHIHNSGL